MPAERPTSRVPATSRLRAAGRGARSPARVDLAAALLLTLFSALVPASPPAAHGPRAGLVTFALAAGCWLPLAWRRRAPLSAFAVSLASQLCGILSAGTFPNIVAADAVIYLLATQRRRPALLCTAMALVTTAAAGASVGWQWRILLTQAPPVAALAWGEAVRARRGRAQALLERAEAAERDRDVEARRAVAEERLRIARELHDLVAHSMSMIAVQAGSGRMAASTDPQAAARALAVVEEGARQSLVEMRLLLGVLRGGEASEDRSPSPVLAELDELAQRTRAAGLAVQLTIEGQTRELSPALELSAYRIIQEALTNVLRHAPGASAQVKLTYRADTLDVEILNTAPDTPRGPGTSRSGHGLIGMTERAALFGGELTAAKTPDGGFAVGARLPLGPHRPGEKEDA